MPELVLGRTVTMHPKPKSGRSFHHLIIQRNYYLRPILSSLLMNFRC
nr:4-21 CRISPR MLO11 [Cucumis sativus]